MSQAALNTHNRIDDKEISFRRKNGVRLSGILFLFIVILTIFISAWMVLNWMENVQHLPLLRLVVTGERHYTYDDDIRQSILALGSPVTFMTHDVKVIQRQIKRLPWIKQASVRKQWPDKLNIHLIEYVPIASWNDQHMFDINGNIFDVPSERKKRKNLPNLYAPEDGDMEILRAFYEIERTLTKNCFMLKDATVTEHHSWQLTLTNGTKLNLGRCDKIKRLSRFIALYPSLQHQAKVNKKQINYVDLRYDSGAAVGWKSILAEEGNQG